jgi:FixJ family two-component response regulator
MNIDDAVPPVERPKIILVDDDPAVRRSLQLLLQGRGYAIRSYASSAALLADPTGLDAACLVTDYRMPELDGFAVLHTLRGRGWQGVAILITAYHSRDLVECALKEGFDCVLEKPLREYALADALARLMGQPAAGRSAFL